MTSLIGKHKRHDIVFLKDNYPEKFGRFIMALANLEASDDWYRICGIHGDTFKPDDPEVLCPTDTAVVSVISETGEPFYCKHSVYSFIAWHTPYVYQFELLLNKYNKSVDKEYITLPYLDLTNFSNDYNFLNDPFITILYDGSPQNVNNPLAYAYYYKDDVKTKTLRNGYLMPQTKRQHIQLNTVRRQLNNVLYARSYERFSSHPVAYSKTNIVADYIPLETPHNTLHDVIGGQGGNMSDIVISAFDPLFWLHHCNMDRHFYTWLYNNTEQFTKSIHPEKITHDSLEATQAPFFKHDIYNADPLTYSYGWLNGGKHYMLLKHMLNVEQFPFTYDIIEPLPKRNIMSSVELIDIPIPRESLTYVIYIYLKTEELNKETHFAGSAFWFGVNRREVKCDRCEVTRTNITIDIDEYANEHGITKENISEYNVVLEGEGNMIREGTGYKSYSQIELIKDGAIEVILK